jgi:predicted MFS family arabinose efflux permease
MNAPPDKQGSAFGLAGSGNALAQAIMPLLGGTVAAALGIRTVFLVLGAGMLVISVVAAAVVPQPRRQAEVVTATEAAAD